MILARTTAHFDLGRNLKWIPYRLLRLRQRFLSLKTPLKTRLKRLGNRKYSETDAFGIQVWSAQNLRVSVKIPVDSSKWYPKNTETCETAHA